MLTASQIESRIEIRDFQIDSQMSSSARGMCQVTVSYLPSADPPFRTSESRSICPMLILILIFASFVPQRLPQYSPALHRSILVTDRRLGLRYTWVLQLHLIQTWIRHATASTSNRHTPAHALPATITRFARFTRCLTPSSTRLRKTAPQTQLPGHRASRRLCRAAPLPLRPNGCQTRILRFADEER